MNATDFYAHNYYSEYLYYNPYSQDTVVTFHSPGRVDLFDRVSNQYLASDQEGAIRIRLTADAAALVVVLPPGQHYDD